MRTYKKPMITVDSGLTEGVYAASGASQGTLNVEYYGVWDRWGTNGGKGLAMANWSDLNGTITLNITFNDTVDQAETDDASVQTSWSGKTATFTFASTASNPLTILTFTGCNDREIFYPLKHSLTGFHYLQFASTMRTSTFRMV